MMLHTLHTLRPFRVSLLSAFTRSSRGLLSSSFSSSTSSKDGDKDDSDIIPQFDINEGSPLTSMHSYLRQNAPTVNSTDTDDNLSVLGRRRQMKFRQQQQGENEEGKISIMGGEDVSVMVSPKSLCTYNLLIRRQN